MKVFWTDYEKFAAITNEYRDDTAKVNDILENFAVNAETLKNYHGRNEFGYQ